MLFVPWLAEGRMAARMEKDPRKSHVEMEIYPDSIDVGSGEGQWEIPWVVPAKWRSIKICFFSSQGEEMPW